MVADPTPLDGIHTPDRRYLVVRRRLWRATNPALSADDRRRVTAALMEGRRAVARSLRSDDPGAVREARKRVDRAKRDLGERGDPWWTDGSPDYNRRLVANTPYGEWYHRMERFGRAILALLGERSDGASVCPSDVARSEQPRQWRSQMDTVRDAARHLARQDLIVITQRGRRLDPDEPFKGPVRFRALSTK
jgi:hypothetical protein